MSIKTILQSKWTDELCPLVNGVIFENGHVECVEIDRSAQGAVEIEHLGTMKLDDFLRENPNDFSSLTQFCLVELPQRGLRITAGGGSGGGDGYIAVADLHSNHLKWILFCDDANEFEKLGIRDEIIIAENNHQETWEIPLSKPEDFRIHPNDPRANQ